MQDEKTKTPRCFLCDAVDSLKVVGGVDDGNSVVASFLCSKCKCSYTVTMESVDFARTFGKTTLKCKIQRLKHKSQFGSREEELRAMDRIFGEDYVAREYDEEGSPAKTRTSKTQIHITRDDVEFLRDFNVAWEK